MISELPAVYMRGGTSRALMFHRHDLPDATPDDGYAAWTPYFLRAIGSPDPNQRQLNGMGGGISSLSKIAVIGPPSREDVDVDYTFAQVSVTSPSIGYRGNCGNISSAVGPFAVDEGLVSAKGAEAVVRIHNTNTGKIIRSSFPVSDGRSVEHGDFVLPGVAGTGAPIRLDFMDPAGAATGKLLPGGLPRQHLTLEDQTLEVSLVDAANPVCFVEARSLALTGRETPSAIGNDRALMNRLISLRAAAGVEMGLIGNRSEALTRVTNMPLICLVARPDPVAWPDREDCDIVIRMISMDQPHLATPLTGALCLAAASAVDGTLVRSSLRDGADIACLRVRHPSGVLPLAAEIDHGAIKSITAYRTARRLMSGMVRC
ncbi:PrpF domain-containing protein [Oceanicola sp. 502str15]|uniref:PrpF domain-containing protein n=1 Tax=Oceanicola sp. 502str15 TaxID=2696061 RepID=UPI00209439E0|nr:PrpF domain-containing protein [Oceanicola sp. 502str15]MCO6385284.1 PrpF family protein [Oceanicola sp. 502str15]